MNYLSGNKKNEVGKPVKMMDFYSENITVSTLSKGFAENSVNATSFRKNALTTCYCGAKKYQFAAYYNASAEILLAKRAFGGVDTTKEEHGGNGKSWEIYNTELKGTIQDAHNVISIGVDGNGFIHMAWSNHSGAMMYALSDNAYSLNMKLRSMIGTLEDHVTYPEFYNLPDGDLLFLYRNGSSGNGNLVLNRYLVSEGKWVRILDNLISGEGKFSPYWQAAVDGEGRLHISWVWRETPDVATNFNMNYAVSADGSYRTFAKSDGTLYELPITERAGEIVRVIPQNSALINQTSMTVDDDNLPYIVTYWRERGAVQYHILRFDGKEWIHYNTDIRKTDFVLASVGTKKLPCARPQILVKGSGTKAKVLLLFRDEERNSMFSTATFEYIGENGTYTLMLREINDITKSDAGEWEPNVDIALWKKEKQVNTLFQKSYYSCDATENKDGVREEEVYVIEINDASDFDGTI